MKKFKFTLDPLLEVRKRKEDAVKLELGQKNREIITAKDQMLALHDSLKEYQTTEKARRGTSPDVQSMRWGVAFRNKVKLDMIEKGNEIEGLKTQALKIQDRLTNATKERRAIEIIGEHRHAEWKRDVLREEQKSSDDLSQKGYIRKQRAAAAGREPT